MVLVLKRIDQAGDGVRGVMFVPGNTDKIRQPIATLENARYLIPEGTYNVTLTHSPKFGKVMPLIDVPKRAGIRIHTGSIPQHSTGCVLVTNSGYDSVTALIKQGLKDGRDVFLKVLNN